MSGYPVVLEGSTIVAVVIGGGAVALRKATALLESGARVHVVAPDVHPDLTRLADARPGLLRVTSDSYRATYLADATLVVAATGDGAVNSQVAADARERGALVNVVDAPSLGNFITPAVHRSGEVLVAVSAGGAPKAAVRIRDAIALTIDARYADAVRELTALRRSLLDAGNRERWTEASSVLVGERFCEQVESGDFVTKVAEWR